MKNRPPSPPQFELYPGWLPSSAPAPKPELPFQRSKEIDVRRVGKILGVSKNTILRMIDDKLLRAYRIDRSIWRIEYDSVVDYCNRLRVHYRISEDRLLRKPAHGRLRDEDLLPFPLAQTVYYDAAVQRLDIDRKYVFRLIESGDLTGYQILIDTRASPWRIYEPSLDRYIDSLNAQVSTTPRLHRTPSLT